MLETGFLMLCGLLVSAIAVKHAGYILMYGSIFESLRGFIADKMEEGAFGFEKLNELFTCKVCMSTQVAIWLVAVPLTLSGVLPGGGILIKVAGFAVIAFAVAGVAVWFWNLSEYRVQKFEEQARQYRSKITELRRELVETQTRKEEEL